MTQQDQKLLKGYLVDYHMHTERCNHASGSMNEYVAQAIKVGLNEIGFSDHLPLSPAPEGLWDLGWAMLDSELEDYVDDVYNVKKLHPEIEVKLGIEADFFDDSSSIEKTKQLLGRHNWDYVIGSVHHIGLWPIDSSNYLTEFERKDLYKTYEEYFAIVINAANSGLFDILGHLDVIKKYGYRPKEDLHSLYRDVAKEIKASGIAFEINTSGLRKPAKELYPAPLLVKELLENGVPVTLGSDSHLPSEVGADFDKALALLKSCGVNSIATFTDRKRTLVSVE